MNRFGATRNSGQRWLLYPLVIAPLLFTGCRSHNVQSKPVVEITQVPVATLGGPAQMDSVEGRVRNVKPGEQVVLYARSGAW